MEKKENYQWNYIEIATTFFPLDLKNGVNKGIVEIIIAPIVAEIKVKPKLSPRK